MKRLTWVLWSVFLVGACQSLDTPERVAITFVELYVFRFDQKSALELSDDLAADKLRRELADVEGVRALGKDFADDPRRPALSRKLLYSVADDAGWRFLYEIAVRPKGGTPYERYMTLRVARRDDKWRVVDYEFPKEPVLQPER